MGTRRMKATVGHNGFEKIVVVIINSIDVLKRR